MTKFTVEATLDIVVNVEAEDEEAALDAAEPFVIEAWNAMNEAVESLDASISGTYDDWIATETA